MKTIYYIFSSIDEFSIWLDKSTFNRTIKLLQIHHTYKPSYEDFNGKNHYNLLESMENYHVNVKGYAQIAQNITIFPDGKIAICRPFDKNPAGILGANQYGLCIENIGNFDTGNDSINSIQKQTIINTVKLLCKKFKITPNIESIVYHYMYNLVTGNKDNIDGFKTNDINHKSCPGTGFIKYQDFIKLLND